MDTGDFSILDINQKKLNCSFFVNESITDDLVSPREWTKVYLIEDYMRSFAELQKKV